MGHQFFCLKDVLTKFKIMVIYERIFRYGNFFIYNKNLILILFHISNNNIFLCKWLPNVLNKNLFNLILFSFSKQKNQKIN